MQRIKSAVLVVGVLAAAMFFNQECQSQTSAPAPAAQPAAPAAAAPAAAPVAAGGGSIVAKAAFTGPAPVMPRLKREADPFCAKTPMTDEEVLVNPNGTLKNVVIRVTAGAPAGVPPADAVTMDQNNCMYRPRVVGGVVGQKLAIHNSDPVLHNVHTYVGATTGFNQAQMKGSKDIEKTITAGVMKFKCDVHPWMTGYIVGNDNPLICVTKDSGDCTIANVPPGTYTIEAWHEKFGVKTATVSIVASGAPAVTGFSFP